MHFPIVCSFCYLFDESLLSYIHKKICLILLNRDEWSNQSIQVIIMIDDCFNSFIHIAVDIASIGTFFSYLCFFDVLRFTFILLFFVNVDNVWKIIFFIVEYSISPTYTRILYSSSCISSILQLISPMMISLRSFRTNFFYILYIHMIKKEFLIELQAFKIAVLKIFLFVWNNIPIYFMNESICDQ